MWTDDEVYWLLVSEKCKQLQVEKFFFVHRHRKKWTFAHATSSHEHQNPFAILFASQIGSNSNKFVSYFPVDIRAQFQHFFSSNNSRHVFSLVVRFHSFTLIMHKYINLDSFYGNAFHRFDNFESLIEFCKKKNRISNFSTISSKSNDNFSEK